MSSAGVSTRSRTIITAVASASAGSMAFTALCQKHARAGTGRIGAIPVKAILRGNPAKQRRTFRACAHCQPVGARRQPVRQWRQTPCAQLRSIRRTAHCEPRIAIGHDRGLPRAAFEALPCRCRALPCGKRSKPSRQVRLVDNMERNGLLAAIRLDQCIELVHLGHDPCRRSAASARGNLAMRPLALVLLPALAACRQAAPPAAAPSAAATPAATAPQAAPEPAATARAVSEKSELYEFDYSYPAEAAAIPVLHEWLEADLVKAGRTWLPAPRKGATKPRKALFPQSLQLEQRLGGRDRFAGLAKPFCADRQLYRRRAWQLRV